MKEFLDTLRGRYSDLEDGEQKALLLLASFFTVVVFYLAVWVPINTFVAETRIERDRHLSLLQYIQSTETEAKAAAGNEGKTGSSGQSLLTEVSRSAQGIGINPSRMQPEGDDAVSIWFDTVPFTKLMLWLERLESGKGVVVRQVTIDRRDEPGQVSARLVLRH